jgi:hypothetical protein
MLQSEIAGEKRCGLHDDAKLPEITRETRKNNKMETLLFVKHRNK